ncbi:MAG: hypothetical protein ACYSYL_16755 [Planctomycetota bacterium]|jgi:hypothetical protein
MRWASTYIIDRRWRLGRLELGLSWRRNDGFMGRFGGGWNWKLGVQVGSTTAIFSLLVLAVSVSWRKPDA